VIEKPTIMLIDDNEVDNFINRKTIDNQKFAERIYVHTSSRSALEFLNNFQQINELPDYLLPSVIFLDISMPVMDGYGFMKEFEKLRADFRERIRVVILTSSTSELDISRFNGMDSIIGYYNKPLTVEHLNQIKSLL
jgi:CheY-like chemotaxis protein